MRTIHVAPVTVPAAAPSGLPGTALVTDAQMRGATGAICVVINPSVSIVIVGALDPNVPGSEVGTTTNAASVIPAAEPYVIYHRSGPLYALSTGADSTVKVDIKCEP